MKEIVASRSGEKRASTSGEGLDLIADEQRTFGSELQRWTEKDSWNFFVWKKEWAYVTEMRVSF